MEGICALYQEKTKLRESHIFPKFVINYTKKTGSQYLRKVAEPNIRMQDGAKEYLLGEKAEQEFSKREKWFAENIFHPYISGKRELNYNENLYFFSISLLWRVLVSQLRTEDYKKKWYYEELLKTEKEWRLFLSKSIFPINYNCTYLAFTDRVIHHNTDLKGVDFYFTRAFDATIVSNPSQTFIGVYAKFNKFIFWGIIKNVGNEDGLKNLLINPIQGIFKIPQKCDYPPINGFYYNRMKSFEKFELPNEKQQELIEKEIIKNKEKFWNSDLGKSIFNDNYNLDK
jgi:hypothetical protein